MRSHLACQPAADLDGASDLPIELPPCCSKQRHMSGLMGLPRAAERQGQLGGAGAGTAGCRRIVKLRSRQVPGCCRRCMTTYFTRSV